MPEAWADKDERQYRKVKESARQRGKSAAHAAEIAGRTVNSQRRKEGRSGKDSSQGTGNPNQPLEARTKRELYNRARKLDIAGRSRMAKLELIHAIRSRQ